MNKPLRIDYPTYEEHQRAWETLAAGIASMKPTVREIAEGEIPPNSKPGTLSILGSGIETLGFTIGDEKLIQSADKVLFCVADPATVVWLKRLRPDALDLYVLYGEDKVRYTTYMQMAEAQLFWVRQGLNVVVVFYGHPGIFVLSTHRAIMIARREGHRATMKAGVCALDTLCADLGVDPCHPGLQTHEATDCLTRRRRIDTSLHVILWQVGLIGEVGFRRHGYLNSGFSYFINWLIELYGPEYPITHYIGSRYPTIEPLIAVHALQDLHIPDVQTTITGISTFYLPPRDVVPTDRQTATDLGLLKEGQHLVTPKSPLREIGLYGPREMAAFDAFKHFAIPKSYRWQDNTRASDFLIALRFDPELQNVYRHTPEMALNDPRFLGLSDREWQMLASRDSGAIQIAAKGNYIRSPGNEKMINSLMTSKKSCLTLLNKIRGKPISRARQAVVSWIEEQGYNPDWSRFHASLDYLYRTTLAPWTGVYVTSDGNNVITLIGHRGNPLRSLLYVNALRIRHFALKGGMVQWNEQPDVPFNGFLKLDLQSTGERRLVGKCWTHGESPGDVSIFTADAVDPQANIISERISVFAEQRFGTFVLRSSGRFSRVPIIMTLSEKQLTLAGETITTFTLSADALVWSGGTGDFYAADIRFLRDPVAGSIEIYGECRSQEETTPLRCYGARQADADTPALYDGPSLPSNASKYLLALSNDALKSGGLMLWHKWEKNHLTSLIIAKYLAGLV